MAVNLATRAPFEATKSRQKLVVASQATFFNANLFFFVFVVSLKCSVNSQYSTNYFFNLQICKLLFPVLLVINIAALSQSESSKFFMYIIILDNESYVQTHH